GGLHPDAKFALVRGHDEDWTTNLPLEHLLAKDALVALTHDGEPLSLEHGGPARLIVPQLYAWKSAKWVAGIEFRETDQAGFWEENGLTCEVILGRKNVFRSERIRAWSNL